MIIYFKDTIAYDYLTDKPIDNYASAIIYDIMYNNHTNLDVNRLINFIEEHNESILTILAPVTNLSVNYGKDDSINKQVCINNNIQLFHEDRQGGALVMFPGNIAFHDIRPGNNFAFHYKFMEDFTEWLCNKGLKATTNRNDIMVNDEKIAGAIIELFPEHPNTVFFGSVISINVDVDLINQVCVKPMKKIPGALSKYNITSDEVQNWILNWFNEHQYTE